MTWDRIARFAFAVAFLLVVGMSVAPSSPTLQITDVFGLANSLALRPTLGAGFSLGRTAVINTSGQIDAAAGDLGDCLHVDGSSASCGSTGTIGSNSADNETPQGSVNGVNQTFTLQTSPFPGNSLHLYANGSRLAMGIDYTITGNTITFTGAYVPGTGDTILADYKY